MFVGVCLRWSFVFLLCVGAVGIGAEGQGAGASGPPRAEVRALSEEWYGIKVVDNYRWLEDGASADTQKWVAEEMAYTRGVLDPLPGREAIHKRLSELLHIGDIGVPKIGGKYYFYTRRDGGQNQAEVFVGGGIGGGGPGVREVELAGGGRTNSFQLVLAGEDREELCLLQFFDWFDVG